MSETCQQVFFGLCTRIIGDGKWNPDEYKGQKRFLPDRCHTTFKCAKRHIEACRRINGCSNILCRWLIQTLDGAMNLLRVIYRQQRRSLFLEFETAWFQMLFHYLQPKIGIGVPSGRRNRGIWYPRRAVLREIIFHWVSVRAWSHQSLYTIQGCDVECRRWWRYPCWRSRTGLSPSHLERAICTADNSFTQSRSALPSRPSRRNSSAEADSVNIRHSRFHSRSQEHLYLSHPSPDVEITAVQNVDVPTCATRCSWREIQCLRVS